jgi:methyltransferase (TIGR00027 family)
VTEQAHLIEDVGDTARWVAYHRALESERPDPLFRDPYARRLAGERGRRIADGMPKLPWAYPGARGLTWGLAVRTRAYDDFICRAVTELDADAVVNLAAGLDARPYRLPLPPSLMWIEVDREAMLAEKRNVLDGARPACQVERIALDLADLAAREALLDRVATTYERIVVVTEGLLVYLDEHVVGDLSASLRERRTVRRWVTEMISPQTLQTNSKAWGAVLARGNCPWKFAPADGFDFFSRQGWTLIDSRSCIGEAFRLGRAEIPNGWILRAAMALSTRARGVIESAVRYGVLARE